MSATAQKHPKFYSSQYNYIASIIRKMPPNARLIVARPFADAFEETQTNFKRNIFMKSCEVE